MHSHDGTDGSGLVSHTSLMDIGPDDHHAKDHRHGQDGVDYVHLETDVVGTLGLNHLSPYFWTGKPGELEITRNPQAHDAVVMVKSPDETVYLFYDWYKDGRLEKILTVRDAICVWEEMRFAPYEDEEGNIEEVLVGTHKEIRDVQDADVRYAISTVMQPAPVIP